MPRVDFIDSKRQRLQSMIADLGKNEKVFARIGGFTVQNRGEEIAFQKTRLDNLTWARGVTDEAIQDRIGELSASLTSAELACKYGDVRGFSLERVLTIAMIEDLEIALGTHPALGVE